MNLNSSRETQPLPAFNPALEAAITRALSRQPSIAIPGDFASRLAQKAQAQPQRSARRWFGWGPRLAIGSGVLLTAGMFALAPHAAPSLSNTAFDVELVLLAELSALLLFAQRLLSRD